VIYRIKVWDRSTGEHLLIGEMACDIADGGRVRSAFRYNREFIEGEHGFGLDPVSLPLKGDLFSADPGIFGVFEDSLPDDWGRKLLVRKHLIPRHEQNLPNLLLAISNSGMGALSFTDREKPQPPSCGASLLQLSELVEAAEKFERGDIQTSELTLLFAAGSSPGGARPKALVFDEQNEVHYLAKFPSVKDQEDVVKIEAATMSLAELAGLDVPSTRLIQCAGKSILLVERFDVVQGEQRRHMISFQTLLKAEGFYQMRYEDLLGVVRKYSDDPLEDSERLFRQMTFNAVVGNTDDHLKNFWMVYDRGHGWRLSPAFDLIPDIGRRSEHVLFFDLGAYFPGRKKLEALGNRWGIRKPEMIVEQVFSAMTGWKEVFGSMGVHEKDIARFTEIDTHLEGK
jgi:serine/threonine-protein kinase HipA